MSMFMMQDSQFGLHASGRKRIKENNNEQGYERQGVVDLSVYQRMPQMKSQKGRKMNSNR